MTALLTSRSWPFRALRICILAAVGWWLVKDLVHAQLPDSFAWPNTDFEKRIVDLEEIHSGGPPKDGIPPVDEPVFVSAADADEWLDPREPVVVVEIEGRAKAYPIQILTWHEIVNDELGGRPISVTFCPLCNASIVFDRRYEGEVLDFGTTGKLRKSDLVMYDRQSESWWQQLTGEAIVGRRTGARLTRVPSSIVAYEDYRKAYPEGRVLSRETGHMRSYGSNPYRGYDTIGDQPFLFFDQVDPRLPPMERVLNVTVGGRHKLYPFSALRSNPVINDQFEGLELVVLSKAGTLSALDAETIRNSRTIPSATAWRRTLDGATLTFERHGSQIRDRETGSTWDLLGRAVAGPLAGRRLESLDSGVHFAFAWLAFRPESEIFAPGS